jgi:hypothetical protein
MLIVNRWADPDVPLFNLESLGTWEYARTLATIYDLGHVDETGIRVDSNHTWESTVEKYDTAQIMLKMNATGPVTIEIGSGKFILIEGNDYTISYTDRDSGSTWQEVVEADENRTIQFHLNASSVTIRITLSPDVLGMISLGMSVSVIIISIVIFYYADKKMPKEH